MPLNMEALEIGCAIIQKEDRLLIAQRRPGDHLAGYWEFPGGKREGDETMEDCLVREVREELGVWIRPVEFLFRVDHTYANRDISLHFYHCTAPFANVLRRHSLLPTSDHCITSATNSSKITCRFL